ncbi:MAG: DMT family transporter [Pasteurellaceae bacterium]|nr:DMT family transporter [Pasteurellaceae bacterium]
MKIAKNNLIYHLMMIGVVFFWGMNWSLMKICVQAMPPLVALSWRFLIASFVLLLWIGYKQGFSVLRQITLKQWGGLTIAALFGIFGSTFFLMIALKWVTASKAATVPALNPILPTLLGALFFNEKLNWRIIIGMLLSLCGGLIAIAHGNPLSVFSGNVGIGEYCLLLGLGCWSAYTLVGRVLLNGISPLVATFTTSFLGGLMLILAGLWWDGSQSFIDSFNASTQVWLCLITMAIGATVLAYLWFFDGVQHLGVGASSAYFVLIPIVGIAISIIYLGESLHSSLIFGGGLAIIGMLIMHKARH